MRLVDSRRLRGPNLETRGPAALAEVAFEAGESPETAVVAWKRELARMLEALGWRDAASEARARVFPGGAALTFPASIDALLAATEVNEWAVVSATSTLRGMEPSALEPSREELAQHIATEARPALLALQAEARRRGVPFLADDDAVTLGMGKHSETFTMDGLPTPGDVAWNELGRIPVALVTGTNGKTTCTRLAAHIAKHAGLVAGHTSTDGIYVGDLLVEEGDWTGPGAARLLLRRPDVELAVLESARGGLLRRGLAVDQCDAALITNVSSDHLGEFGVYDLPTMARTKAVVGSVVKPDGRVVLNGADPSLVALANTFVAPVVYFGGRQGNEVAWLAQDGWFVRLSGEKATKLLPVANAPLTFGGAAAHNVENCLAAAALAHALGLPDEAIRAGLGSFDAKSNPGRGQLFELASGVRILADFGHNPDAIQRVLGLARSLVKSRGGRLAIACAQPGDRSNEDIAAFAREVARAHPDAVFVWDLLSHLRGREPEEVPALLRRALLAGGIDDAQLRRAETEADALAAAAAWGKRGDLVVLAPHVDREAVRAKLLTLGDRNASAK